MLISIFLSTFLLFTLFVLGTRRESAYSRIKDGPAAKIGENTL